MNGNISKHSDFLITSMLRVIEINSESIGMRNSSIILRYFSGESMEDIGRSEDVTIERVRQLIERTKEKITSLIEKSNIKEYQNEIDELQQVVEEYKRLQRTIKVTKPSGPIPISELNVSVRTMNILSAARIESAEALAALSPEEISKYRNAGQKTIDEIELALREKGLALGGRIIGDKKKRLSRK